jgi:hypothetical protein
MFIYSKLQYHLKEGSGFGEHKMTLVARFKVS